MECYLCRKLVKRHEYTRHIMSHPSDDFVEAYSQPYPSLNAFSHDKADHDHHGSLFPAHPTPPPFPGRIPSEHPVPVGDEGITPLSPSLPSTSTEALGIPNNVRQQESSNRRSTSNAFQTWLENSAYDFPKYTLIDGQASSSDSQVQELGEVAKVLRHTTREEVVKIVNAFGGFPSDDLKANCLELVRKVPIFPGLVAYTFTHLTTCPTRGWFSRVDWSDQVSKLRKLVDRWTKYGDTQCILLCKTIKEELLEIFRATKVKAEEHKCNSALLSETMVLRYDTLNLAALMASCVTGPRKSDILERCEANVNKLIELFHGLLDSNVDLEESYRRCFLNALIMLSKQSGCYPRSIYLPRDTISVLASKSEGAFGRVFQGKVGSRLVAVKAIKRNKLTSLDEYNKQLFKEAIIWKYLRHPNCLPLYGVYDMPTEGPTLVSPWMDQGTLSKYLRHNPEANKTRLVLDVVRGLNYLHSLQPHIAHRDIKPDNILITGKGRACLADFGFASAFDAGEGFHTAVFEVVMGGTPNYMAPEIFTAKTEEEKSKVNKRACDMYALGCTIYEVYTGKPPFYGTPQKFPADVIPHDMGSFVENLWDLDPPRRLTAQMALKWMEFKAAQEGIDPGLLPFEEEWEWKGSSDNNSLWSIDL